MNTDTPTATVDVMQMGIRVPMRRFSQEYLTSAANAALARLAVDEGWDKREASGTTKIQDPNIGREWDTQKGRRQIVGTFGDDMYEAKNMSTGGVLRIFKAKLEEQIAADQFAMTPEYAQQKEVEKAARDAQAARDAEDAAKGAALDAEIAKWTSDAGMSAMLAERARAALTKNRNADGRIATVGEIIREEVAAGAVVSEVRGEARLTAPSGSFLGEAQITKMGMDYARWLVAKSGSTGAATQRATDLECPGQGTYLRCEKCGDGEPLPPNPF